MECEIANGGQMIFWYVLAVGGTLAGWACGFLCGVHAGMRRRR